MTSCWRRNERQPSERAGMVIIEVVAVITVMAMLLGITVTLFAALYGIERSWGGAAVESGELRRLAAYFREDAHRAADIQIAEDGKSWSFVLTDERRVEYEVLADAVSRTVRTTTGEQRLTERRQELRVPEEADIDVQDRSLADKRMISLVMAAESSDRDGGDVFLRVDAELGRMRAEGELAHGRIGSQP